MSKRKKQNIAGTPGAQAAAPGMITTSGIMPRPGQSAPGVVILTAPRRFGIDIADYMQAVRSAENVDMPSRTSLYDLYTDILADTHLSSVIDKRVNAVLATGIEFRKKDNTPHERINEQIRSPWFSRLVHDILMSRFWGFSVLPRRRLGRLQSHSAQKRLPCQAHNKTPPERPARTPLERIPQAAVRRRAGRPRAPRKSSPVGNIQAKHHRRLVAVLRSVRYAHPGVHLRLRRRRFTKTGYSRRPRHRLSRHIHPRQGHLPQSPRGWQQNRKRRRLRAFH